MTWNPTRRRLALLACAVVVALRAPLLVLEPRLVAEEASVYLAHALSHGFLQGLLLVPTSDFPAGYFNLPANLAALLGARVVPLELAAVAALAVAFAIQLVPFAVVLWGRSHFWNTPRRRLACCLVLLFAPALHPTVWLSTINAQVFCGLIAFLILCEDTVGATGAPASQRRRWTYRALLVFCGLSGPYTATLVPAFLAKQRLLQRRGFADREPGRQLAIVAGTAGIQLAAYASTVMLFGLTPSRLDPSTLEGTHWPALLAGIFAFHVLQPLLTRFAAEPLGLLFSQPVIERGAGLSGPALFLCGMASLLALLALGFYLGRRRDPLFRLFWLSFASVATTTVILAYGLPRHRYSVLPGMILLLALLVGSWGSRQDGRRQDGRRTLCRIVLDLALGLGLATYWAGATELPDGPRLSIFGYGKGRPVWTQEVAAWRADPRHVLRVWPYSRDLSWQTLLPRRGDLRELRPALAAVEDFHLAAGQAPAERRIAVPGLPIDFKVVVRGEIHQTVPRGRLELVFENVFHEPLARTTVASLRHRGEILAHFASQRLATADSELETTRYLALRAINKTPGSTAVAEIHRVEIAPRVEGLLDGTLPSVLLPSAMPTVWSWLNLLLFSSLAALTWRDRRDEGVAGAIFALGSFFGAAALGFVLLPGTLILKAFCLFVPLRWWVRGELRGPLRLLGSGALALAFAAMTLAGSAVPAGARGGIQSDETSMDGATAFALRAWDFFTSENGLVIGYPFALLALLLFVREPLDRRRGLLFAALLVAVQWIIWQPETSWTDPPGSARFAVLAPLFVLLPRRIGSWHAPAIALGASLLFTLGLASAAWAPSNLAANPAASRLAAFLILAGAAAPAGLARRLEERQAPPWSAGSRIALPRVIIPAGLLALLVGVSFWGFSYDDNFITYRYAQNVLEGHGLVFNPGQRVLGTSAPGYALVLAGLTFLSRPFGVEVPHWGTLLSLLSILSLTGTLAAAKGSRRVTAAVPVGFAVLALGSRLDFYLLGSEVFPVIALATLAGYFLLVRERPLMAGVFSGAACVLRLDAALATLALVLVDWRRQRRFPTAFAGPALSLPAAWLIFLYGWFGTVVPNTLGGKTALFAVPHTLRLWETLTASLPAPANWALLSGALAGLGLAWRSGLWRRPLFLYLALWLVAHEIFYRAIGVWFAPWYHLHLGLALLALFSLAAVRAASWLAARVRREKLRALFFAALLGVVLWPGMHFILTHWGHPPDRRYPLLREAAEHLRDRAPAGSEVLAMEVGVLGYFCECRVLDLGGLVSPPFTAAKFTGRRASLVARLRPDYILAAPGDPLLREALLQGVRDQYTVETRFRDEDGHRLRLLRRRNVGRRDAGGAP